MKSYLLHYIYSRETPHGKERPGSLSEGGGTDAIPPLAMTVSREGNAP